jgi:uncharacterized protein (DUF927 family)
VAQHCVLDSAQLVLPNKQTLCADTTQSSGDEPAILRLEGARAPSGQRWVKVSQGEDSVWLRHADFRGYGLLAEEKLAAGGIVLIGARAKARLLAQAAAVQEFPDRFLIERSGWTASHFALPSGELIAGDIRDLGEVVFRGDPTKCTQAGSLGTWKREVAAPLAGQDIPSLLLMAAFAAPLLALTPRTDNFGFELVGAGGCGKTTIQQIVASAAGAPGHPNPYWMTMDTTLAGLEEAMPIHADMPMILDEANLYAGSAPDAAYGKHIRVLVFKLANGTIKARYKATETGSYRYLYITSANQSFGEIARSARSATYKAAADRLITLRIADDAPFGVFGPLPSGVLSSGEFADSLRLAATRSHGKALRRFLHHLVRERVENEAALREKIAACMSEFRRAAGVAENDGSAKRVADAFGLVATAGRAAVKYGALPQSFRCMEAALTCYDIHRREVR